MTAVRTKEQVQKYIESGVFKVPVDNGCWLWLGLVDEGYGKLNWNRPGMPKLRRAHRVTYAAYKGEPGSLHVCHTCDNPVCVNPDHLFLGTNADNIADKVKKGRQARLKGVQNPNRKLTEAEVLEIRRLVAGGMTQSDVASHFGVTRQLANYIVHNKRWPHI